ncbi:MAG: hypothetical protein DRQ88_12415 [Epsilonproteobacteria bacterium]|nr:MAG: hypothetical protein DRQ88_12415 [Campylobacterota bacterium]
MKEWKTRQELYHRMFTDHSDVFTQFEIELNYDKDTIIKRALEYPTVQSELLYYPAKSYAVGIIFAHKISEKFNEDFYETLNDPDLLYKNDPYFVPYQSDKSTYDRIISEFPLSSLDQLSTPNLVKTLEYFEKEFLFHKKTCTLISKTR